MLPTYYHGGCCFSLISCNILGQCVRLLPDSLSRICWNFANYLLLMHIFIGCLGVGGGTCFPPGRGHELTGNEVPVEILRRSWVLKGLEMLQGCGLINSREEAVTMLLTNLVPIYGAILNKGSRRPDWSSKGFNLKNWFWMEVFSFISKRTNFLYLQFLCSARCWKLLVFNRWFFFLSYVKLLLLKK